MPDQNPDPNSVLDYRELGSTGLRRFSGFVFDEFLKELTGWKGMAVFKEMSRNDAVVASMLFAVRSLVRQVKWWTKEASTQLQDVQAKDYLQTCMDDMNDTWIDFIDQAMSMIIYGFSPHEICYKKRLGDSEFPSRASKFDDGRIGWAKLPVRSQDTIYRWQFSEHGEIEGLFQLAPPTYRTTFIPANKLLLFRTITDKNNPEGFSILRGAYRAWYNKKFIENIEGIGIERDLAGLPVITAPPEIFASTASNDQKALFNKLKDIVVNIRRDEQEGVVMPAAYDAAGNLLYELKLLSTGGSRQFDTDKIIKRYDQRIAMTAMADFLLLGHERVGSFALASSKTETFATAIGGFLDSICAVLNRQAVPDLFRLNDFRITAYPEICHGDLETPDLEEVGKYLQALAASGYPLYPNKELEKYLMDIGGMPTPIDPEQEEEDITIEQSKGKPTKITTEIPWTPGQGGNPNPSTAADSVALPPSESQLELRASTEMGKDLLNRGK